MKRRDTFAGNLLCVSVARFPLDESPAGSTVPKRPLQGLIWPKVGYASIPYAAMARTRLSSPAADGEKYVSRNYDNAGQVSDYTAAMDGQQWRIDGAAERFRGEIAANGKTLTGLWQRYDADRWIDWMRVTLTRRG